MNCNVFYLFSSFRRNDPGDRLPCSVFILLLFAPMESGGSHIGKNIPHSAGRVFGQYDVIPRFTGCQPDGFARTTVENIPCRSLRVENAECGSVFGIRLFVYQSFGTRWDDEQILNGCAVQNPREYPFAFYPSGWVLRRTNGLSIRSPILPPKNRRNRALRGCVHFFFRCREQC